mgnify:CR=1 FL=1
MSRLSALADYRPEDVKRTELDLNQRPDWSGYEPNHPTGRDEKSENEVIQVRSVGELQDFYKARLWQSALGH